MAEVRIFLSLEFAPRSQFLRASKGECRLSCKGSFYRVKDHSLREDHPNEQWLGEAKKISQCDIVIILVGQDTHNAPGVKK